MIVLGTVYLRYTVRKGRNSTNLYVHNFPISQRDACLLCPNHRALALPLVVKIRTSLFLVNTPKSQLPTSIVYGHYVEN